jgi:alpha-1,3-rhamnosyl/mannosyltransferase
MRLRNCLPMLGERLMPEIDAVALFPNTKSCSGRFEREGFILHDLSAICTPQFHTPETVAEHSERIRRDIATSDAIFCVSLSTLEDARRYFPAAEGRLHLARNGSEVPEESRVEIDDGRYLVVILGTLEPRKNTRALLELIAQQPALAEACRFVFPGRYGWGRDMESIIAELGLAHLVGDSLVFPGYVTEEVKHALLASADLLVYPSVHEGFGLPVLEAALHGTPVLTTRSTALPEIDLPGIHHFSPFIEGDLLRGLTTCLQQPSRHRLSQRQRDAFRWQRVYQQIRDTLVMGDHP